MCRGTADGEAHSYLELADALRRYGAAPREDCAQLWRRIVFNILISNSDDHLRNHGFLYASRKGWRLSPASASNPPNATAWHSRSHWPLLGDIEPTAFFFWQPPGS